MTLGDDQQWRPCPPLLCESLPADPVGLTGRDAELARITESVRAASRLGRPLPAQVISGPPGTGKTALAIGLGHRLASDLPDRQLFVDLHAHTPGLRPADPADALTSLLSADGMDARFLPADVDRLAACWRERMAGRRALLILDNSAKNYQVEPLLPRSSQCLVVVTGRGPGGCLLPGAAASTLTGLPAADAETLFTRLAPADAGEGSGIAGLVAACGHLPLPITLLARLPVWRPGRRLQWRPARLAGMLARKLGPLPAAAAAGAAAIDLSYQCLPPDHQRGFRQLCAYPGTDLSERAAVALTGLSCAEVAGLLSALCQAGLLRELSPGRYHKHDLVLAYARELVAGSDTGYAADRAKAVGLVARHYLADASLPWNRATPWPAAERAGALASIGLAAAHGQQAEAIGLTAALASRLRGEGPWTWAVLLHRAAGRLARETGDRAGEAEALTELAFLRCLTGEPQLAADDLVRAIGICRDLGDQAGEALACQQLGNARRLSGNHAGAVAVLNQALALYRDLGNRTGEGQALTWLGAVSYAQGDLAAAVTALEQALSAHRDLGNRADEARALNWLGAASYARGDHAAAVTALEAALAIHRDLGNRSGEGNVLEVLQGVWYLTGDYLRAGQAFRQALSVHRAGGNLAGEADSFSHAAQLYFSRGDLRRARSCYRRALMLARASRSPSQAARAQAGLRSCQRALAS